MTSIGFVRHDARQFYVFCETGIDAISAINFAKFRTGNIPQWDKVTIGHKEMWDAIDIFPTNSQIFPLDGMPFSQIGHVINNHIWSVAYAATESNEWKFGDGCGLGHLLYYHVFGYWAVTLLQWGKSAKACIKMIIVQGDKDQLPDITAKDFFIENLL